MAQARMRKTFAYPDSESDSEPEDLDEEEQEKLIEHLKKQDAEKTENYKRAFMTLPVLSIILYLPTISTSTLLTHILAISSLVASAYALWIIPSSASNQQHRSVRTGAILGRRPSHSSPVKKYIDHLNAGLCVLLALMALQAKRKEQTNEMWLAALPGIVFLVSFLMKAQLKPLDVSELEKLRYDYKGA